MPTPQETYNRAVIRARFLYRGVPEEWADELSGLERTVAEEIVEEQGSEAFIGLREQQHLSYDEAYAEFLARLEDAFPSGVLSEEDVQQIIDEIAPALATLSVTGENLTQQGANEGIRQALEAHRSALQAAAGVAGLSISLDLLRGLYGRVKARMEGRTDADAPTVRLVRRVHTGAQDSLASFIRAGTGRPGREVAREILAELTRHDRIRRAVDDMGPRGEAVRRALQRAGRAETALSEPGRSMYQNARRVLVHEQNQAFHEADVLAAEESPAVQAIRWSVSLRHPGLRSSPDVCDIMEVFDFHGYGGGLFYPGATPSLLHPYCECPLGYVTAPPAAWESQSAIRMQTTEDRVPDRTPTMISVSEAREILASRQAADGPTLTGSYVARQAAIANRKVQVAHDAFTDF